MSILKYIRLGFFGVVLVVLTACGDGEKTVNIVSQIKGVAQLGYISNADVYLYKVSNLQKSIATTKTSTSREFDKAGSFKFEEILVEDDTYYLVTVSGGEDIDADDNHIIDNVPTQLKGTVHALAKGSALKSGIRVNAFTDMAYTKIKSKIKLLSFSQIQEVLTQNSKIYLFDVNGDSTVDYNDILGFNPVEHKDKTKVSYSDILDIYVPTLHNNTDESKKLSALMYVDTPQISISNGRLQEVPFSLNATLVNLPDGLNVKWFINNDEKTLTGESISEDGIYQLSARLYRDDILLKTISTSLIATHKKEISSVQAKANENNTILITEESNSSLAGTQIYIPKGALKEDTKIVVKKASINVLPSDIGAVSISDVLVLQPSGMTFDKPVQIRMPYDENLELNVSTVRIARYSEGGLVDYISPLYVDKEKYEIVFETEHFTEFQAETDLFGKSDDEKFITKLNDEFPELKKDIKEWNIPPQLVKTTFLKSLFHPSL